MTDPFKVYKDVFNSRKVILEMLEDRGFNVDHLKNYTEEEIKIMLNEHKIGKFGQIADIGPLDIFLEKNIENTEVMNDKQKDKDKGKTEKINEKGNEKGNEKILIKYRLDPKFKNTANLQLQISEIYEKYITNKDTLIILNNSKILMTPGVKDKTDEEFSNSLFIGKGQFVQLFGIENFLINVNRHQFVPRHRIISKQETQELITKYNCSIKNIPTIKRDDAQAKYIGLRPKQICEITADNITSGETTRYRLCVH